MRHLRELAGLRLVEHGVGGDDADRGRRAGFEGGRQLAAQQCRGCAEQALAVRRAGPGNDVAAGRIDHVADRIHRDERRDREAARAQRSRADAAAHRAIEAEQLADAGTRAGADVALDERAIARTVG